MSDLTGIQDLLSAGGNTRRGMKILTFGPTGSGKSPLLASFPRPLVAVDCGEGGIQPYLKPPLPNGDGKPKPNLDRVFAGEEDLCVTVSGPADLDRVIEFCLANEDKLASVVFDGFNLAWDEHMDYWSERLGGDIKLEQWRLVKGPWKAKMKKLMRSTLHVGMSAWLRDISYDRVEGLPGGKARTEVNRQEVAAIEKGVPYVVDLCFQMRVIVDKLNRPTPKHEIVVTKGRRPSTVDPKNLHVGKTFQWRSDKTEDLWALCVEPYIDAWKRAPRADVVEYMGMDAEEAERERRAMDQAADDTEAGALIRMMYEAHNAGDFKTVAEFAQYWGRAVAPTINDMSPAAQGVVIEAKDAIKAKLEESA